MKRVQVCMSPALIPFYDLEGKTVVVTDVLRATSTMVSALELGVKEIIPVASRAEAKEYLLKDNHFIAGERDGKKVEDFHFGNSPLLLRDNVATLQESTLVMTTTNGTKAIQQSLGADAIFVGALNNVDATANYLKDHHSAIDILIVCAGWKNRVNMEDTLFAGALCDALRDSYEIYGDASIISLELFNLHKDNLIGCIKNATHYQRLKSHGIDDDIAYCMTLNNSEVVGKLVGESIVCV